MNSAAGVRIESVTIKALLTPSALQRFEPGAYRFCPSSDCEAVYFDGQGRVFRTGDLRVGVWQKQPEGDRTLCYCFGENERDMRAEIAREGQSGAVERVRAHIQAVRCACEIRNPRGVCCLGDLTIAAKRLAAAATKSGVETVP